MSHIRNAYTNWSLRRNFETLDYNTWSGAERGGVEPNHFLVELKWGLHKKLMRNIPAALHAGFEARHNGSPSF